jgi:2-phosphoglycerate kinase
MNKIILIGGAPTVGKTYLAKRLSKKLNIPWTSTDKIRSSAKKRLSKKEHPSLFKFVGKDITAEKYLSSHTPKQIFDDQNEESIAVWELIKEFITSIRGPYIIEGVAILPSLINETFEKNSNINPLFLLNGNKEQIKKVVYTRGLWGNAKDYSDDVKPIEVEWASLFNNWLEKEVKKYKYPLYKIKEWDYPLGEITGLVS